MNNPKWNNEEIIMSLNLNCGKNRRAIDKKNEKIAARFIFLNRMNLALEKKDKSKFRNVNGVCLKLSNFVALDSFYNGKGIERFGKL